MKPVKLPDGWWIVEVPECCDCGPYDTKAEAESDMRGLKRFEKYEDKPGYVTGDTQRRKASNQEKQR